LSNKAARIVTGKRDAYALFWSVAIRSPFSVAKSRNSLVISHFFGVLPMLYSPEAANSSPAPATVKTADLLGFRRFFFIFIAF